MRNTSKYVTEVTGSNRQSVKERRKAFLARTEGQVWDEETQQFVEQDEYTEDHD